MDDKTFVLLSNQFKKECDQLKEAQQKSRHNLGPSRNSKTVSYVLKGGEGQADIKFLTQDIAGQVIDWIAVYPADKGVRPYKQRIKIH